MKLIVGLGNPGKQYAKTRHNIGFMVLDEIQKTVPGISEWKQEKKFNAEVCGGMIHGTKVILAKPQTYMNASGEAVGLIGRYYKIPAKDLIVVHDEKDLPLGELRIQEGRGHAGHNGVRSIIDISGTKDFTRIRVGIASSSERKMRNTSKFVLGKFGFMERTILPEIMKQIVEKTLETIK